MGERLYGNKGPRAGGRYRNERNDLEIGGETNPREAQSVTGEQIGYALDNTLTSRLNAPMRPGSTSGGQDPSSERQD